MHPFTRVRTQENLNAESLKAQGFWQQIQTLALSEQATKQQVAKLDRLKQEQEEASHRQASQLAQRLESTEREASREQQRMNAKISRMKQLSDLALGIGKGAAGTAAGEPPSGTKERNRALLYDNVRKG